VTTLSEFKELVVDLSEPRIQKAADRLVNSLLTRTDIGAVVGVLTVALCRAFLLVLHSASPTPDTNIAALKMLASKVADTIAEHEACATALTEEVPTVKGKYEVH
jgi:F420-0:gamma-glutamyl ligase